MVRIIKTHNQLNGFAFTIAEFVIIAAVVAPFLGYYVLHSRVGLALVSAGLVLNCLTVIAIAVRQLVDKEPQTGWKRLRDRAERRRVANEYPTLSSDTMFLTGAVLLPFLLTVLTGYELLIRAGRPKG